MWIFFGGGVGEILRPRHNVDEQSESNLVWYEGEENSGATIAANAESVREKVGLSKKKMYSLFSAARRANIMEIFSVRKYRHNGPGKSDENVPSSSLYPPPTLYLPYPRPRNSRCLPSTI